MRYYSFILSILFIGFSTFKTNAQCTVSAAASSVDILCGDTVKLSAIGSGVLAFRNNFNCGQVQCPEGDPNDPDANVGTWSNSSTAQFDNPCLPDHPSGSPHIWFNNASPSPRTLATNALPLSTGGSIIFDMRMADPDLNGNASPCENPDAAGEGVHLQYSIDNGATWVDIAYYSPGNGNDPVRTVWTTYEEVLPPAANSPNTLIRWAQLENSGTLADNLDHWGLDNLEVIANPPNAEYTWAHTNNPLPNGSTPNVVPVNNTTYTITYNDGVHECQDDVTINVRRQTLNVNVNPTPPICPGDVVTMDADAEIDIPNYVCGTSNECQGSTRTINLGLGNITDDTYQALGVTNNGGGPITISGCNNGVGNATNFARTQFIILADEFPNFLEGGQIYQLALKSAQAGDWPNFTISMGCTQKTSFASAAANEFVPNLSTVYTTASHSFQAGWNEIGLDQKYVWDGTSNIVVQICWRNAENGLNGEFEKTVTPFTSVIHTNSCTGTLSCADGYIAGNAVTDNNRPSFKVDMCYRLNPNLQYAWSPTTALSDPNSDVTDANPTTTTTYTVTVSDANAPPQCAVSQDVQIGIIDFGTFTPSFDEPWCDGQDLQLRTNLTGANYSWTGPNGFTSNDENPLVANAAEGTYSVTVSNGNCSGTSDVVTAKTAAKTAGVGRDTILCQESNSFNLDLILSGADVGGTWLDDNASGILTGNSIDLTLLNKANLPQTLPFTYELIEPCGTHTATVNVTVNPQKEAGENSTASVCNSQDDFDFATLLSASAEPNGRWETMVGNPSWLNGSVVNIKGKPCTPYQVAYIQESSAPCTNDTAFFDLTIICQPYAGMDGTGEVCFNDQINLLSVLQDNPEPNGTWTELTSSGGAINGNLFNPTGVAAGTYRFQYELQGTSPCIASTAIAEVTVNDIPKMANVTFDCNENSPGYKVTFDITNGDPSSYSVNFPGTLTGTHYESDDIPSGDEVTIILTDDKACGQTSLTISKKCDCATEVASMKTDTLIKACEGDSVAGIYLGGFVNDGNDTEYFYLHTSSSPSLGTVLDSNSTGKFGFIPASMTYNTTYYVSSGAGNDNGNGIPSYSDGCFIISAGTPVIFYKNPSASIQFQPNTICPGDQSNLEINIADGSAPFTMEITTSNSDTLRLINLVRNNTESVSELTNTTYTVYTVTDVNGCVGSGDADDLNVDTAPIAQLKNGSDCGTTFANIDITVSGSGTSWDVVLQNDFNNIQENLNGLDASGYNAPPTYSNPDTAITYTLVSVTDNSGSICPGVVTGSYTVNPEPKVTIVGTDSVYCQGNNLEVAVHLNGIGPWDITFEDELGGTYAVSSSVRDTAFQIPNTLAPGNHQITVLTVTDLATGCVGNGTGSANVVINPGPNAQVGFNLTDPVDNNPTKNTTICLDGTTNIDFQYLSGNGTITVNYTIDGNPQSPLQITQGTKTSVPFVSQSISGNRPIVITRVEDNTAAGCVGGGDAANILVKTLPSATVNLPATVCDGATVNFTYNVSGEGTITFDIVDNTTNTLVGTFSGTSNNGISGNFPAPAVGNHSYRIENISDGGTVSCNGTNSNTFNLTVVANPTFDVNTTPIEVCEGTVVNVPYTVTGNQPFDLVFTQTSNGISSQINESSTGDGNLTLNNLSAGTYTLSATTIAETTGSMCSANGNGSTTITVNPNPTVSNIGFSNNPICVGQTTDFGFTVNGNGPFTATFNDGQGNVFTESITDASGNYTMQNITVNNQTTFTITQVTDNSNPTCSATNLPQDTTVEVYPNPEIEFISGATICPGEQATIEYQINNGGATSYSINFEDQNNASYSQNLTSTSGFFNFSQFGGSDSLRLVPVRIVDNIGCIGNGIGEATMVAKPNPSVVIGYTPSLADCAPFAPVAYFNADPNYDTKTANWVWNYNNTTENNVDSIRPTLNTSNANAVVDLTVTTIHGCTNNASLTFTLYPTPIASFNFAPLKPTTLNSEVNFRSTSTPDANSFSWFIDDVLAGNTAQLNKEFPADEEFYNICLAVANSGGCVDTACIDLEVTGELSVYIPNTFTPDGDGINDVFKPIVNRPLEGSYSFQIFNRWGELVFETTDPEKAWDGTNPQGGKPKVGMYVYTITLTSDYDFQNVFRERGTVLIAK